MPKGFFRVFSVSCKTTYKGRPIGGVPRARCFFTTRMSPLRFRERRIRPAHVIAYLEFSPCPFSQAAPPLEKRRRF